MRMKITSCFVPALREKRALFTVFERNMSRLLPVVGIYDGYVSRDLKPIFDIWLNGLTGLLGSKRFVPDVVRNNWQKQFLVFLEKNDGLLWSAHQHTRPSVADLSDEAQWLLMFSRVFLWSFYKESLLIHPQTNDALQECLLEIAFLAIADLFLVQRAVFLPAYNEPEFWARRHAWEKAEKRAQRAERICNHPEGSVH